MSMSCPSIRSLGRPARALAVLLLFLAATVSAQPSGAGGSAGGTGAGGPPAQAGAGTGDGPQDGSTRAGPREAAAGSASPMGATEFGAWLGSAREAARYAAVRDAIRETAFAAIAAGVPAEAFVSRIKEASSKAVPPATLAGALEADAARWMSVAELLRGRDWPPGGERTDFFLAAGGALLNGIGSPVLSALVAWAAGSKAAAGRTGAILGTVASIGNALRWTQETASRFALALAGSRLKTGDLPALAELAVRAASAGVSASAFAEAAESVFLGRGSLADLRKRLFP